MTPTEEALEELTDLFATICEGISLVPSDLEILTDYRIGKLSLYWDSPSPDEIIDQIDAIRAIMLAAGKLHDIRIEIRQGIPNTMEKP